MGTAKDIPTRLGCLSEDAVMTGEYSPLDHRNSMSFEEDGRMSREGKINFPDYKDIGERR